MLHNEKMAPELLPFQHRLVESVKKLILRQEKKIRDQAASERDADDRFYLNIIKMELERIKFIFKSYLRTRLLKIEKSYLYIVEKDQSDLLSEAEQEYAFAIHQSREKHYE